MTIQVFDDADFHATVAAKDMNKLAGEILATTYPGYRWRIESFPHPTKPFFDIRLEAGHARAGITVKPAQFYSSSSLKAHIIKCGGEFLERYHLNRRQLDEVEFIGRKRTSLGLILPEL